MDSIDDLNTWIAIWGILIAILAGVITSNHFRKKTEEDTRKVMKEERDITTQNFVDAVNAQERVRKIGGKVVYRDNKEVGADLKGKTNETMSVEENIIKVLKREKQVVSRHEKQFEADVILKEQQDKQENNESQNS
ncbi:MAG: hypothetical protein Q8O65_03280 [Nitrosopumilaceae archaeon]|nr:hypothetical protein [Nitrosopumilaceae archaeon]